MFDKYSHQSIAIPVECLGINEKLWLQCRSFALNLAKQGFVDPISILYTSFKRYYSSNVTLSGFTRWFLLNDLNKTEFPINSLRCPGFFRAGELVKASQSPKALTFLNPLTDIDQVWFFISISVLPPVHGYTVVPEIMIFDNNITRRASNHKKSAGTRLHCLFAVTPSGKYSNQLIICKPGKSFNANCTPTPFTRIIETNNVDIFPAFMKQWLDDFIALSYATSNR